MRISFVYVECVVHACVFAHQSLNPEMRQIKELRGCFITRQLYTQEVFCSQENDPLQSFDSEIGKYRKDKFCNQVNYKMND